MRGGLLLALLIACPARADWKEALAEAAKHSEDPAAGGASCEELTLRSKLALMAEAEGPNNPCTLDVSVWQDALTMAVARSRAPCRAEELWSRFRSVIAQRLESDPKDPVGRRAAAFLRRSSVSLHSVDMPLSMGKGVSGTYETARHRIDLPREALGPVFAQLQSTGPATADQASAAEAVAAVLVHELRHAAQFEALGYDTPGFEEEELIPHAEAALFTMGRLKNDPAYLGLEEFNRVILSTAGLPAPPRDWWKQPLDFKDVRRLHAANDSAKAALGPRLASGGSDKWFLVRSFAAGHDGLLRNMRWLAADEPIVVDRLPPQFLPERLALLKKRKVYLESCRDKAPDAQVRAFFDDYLAGNADKQVFASGPKPAKRLAKWLKRERKRQAKELKRLLESD